MASIEVLAGRFRSFADTSTATRAPLYSRLSAAAADDPDLLRLLHAAPETQQIPVLLFAAVHHLLLQGLGPELAAFYPNLTERPRIGDPVPLFRSFAVDHAEAVTELIATRHTQTNEVGRCAQFVPVLAMVERECGPLALVDVGTSAGLNLLLHRYSYEYEPGGVVGADSTVHIHCATRGDEHVPVPRALPIISRAIGLDVMPIDVLDDDEVRWLEACVWPDQADRFARLVAAIALARTARPDIRRGDAVDDLPAIVREASASGHPVITNSWVLNYLPQRVRDRYVATLDVLGREFDLSWVIAEAPAQTPGLPVPTTDPPEEITVVSLVTWRAGQRCVRRLATTHPHGYWLRWE